MVLTFKSDDFYQIEEGYRVIVNADKVMESIESGISDVLNINLTSLIHPINAATLLEKAFAIVTSTAVEKHFKKRLMDMKFMKIEVELAGKTRVVEVGYNDGVILTDLK